MSYEKVTDMCLLFRKRQEANNDVLCITTGDRGDGKTNFSLVVTTKYTQRFGLICKACKEEWIFTGKALILDERERVIGINQIKQPCPNCGSKEVKKVTRLNWEKYIAYDQEDVVEKIFNSRKYFPLIGDEAARWALSEEWNSTKNRELKKLFIQIRTKRLITFANIPEFSTMDSKYRNMANYWVRLMQRNDKKAIALFMRKTKGEVKDKWQIDLFQKNLGNYNEDTAMMDVETICDKMRRKHPCVLDYISIPPIPEKIYAEYEEYRDKKVFEREQEKDSYIDRRYMAKVAAYNIVENYKKIVNSVKLVKKYDRPTLKILQELVFINPKTQLPLVKHATLNNWINEIKRMAK